VIDPAVLQMVLGVLTGWLDRREREAIAYLIEENRLLRRQLGTKRLRLTETHASFRQTIDRRSPIPISRTLTAAALGYRERDQAPTDPHRQ
jgi:hypothetical protein